MAEFFRIRELAFQLQELHGLDQVLGHARYAQHDRGSCLAMLEAAHALARDHFLPHAARADAEEPHFDGERVQQPPEVGAALKAYIDGGFLSASFDTEAGGLQLPALVSAAIGALFTAANAGTAGYVFLTEAAARLLLAHASAEQQTRYVRPMLDGRWFGTMCLSEPQAGSSLADIRTRAIPLGDGHYRLVGNKMWISGGEHDLSENIVHLVLARIEGAPAGVKGISLFIVPKRRLNADGTAGARNGVKLMGLNHKMGYRGTTNCALAFGDGEDCHGELIGEAHQGLRYMFHMMNEARIGVGMGAVALGMAGYLHALDYTQQRPQGRTPAEKNPLAPQVMIAEHADVRRMLLQQKAYVEGGLALCLLGARLLDEQVGAADERQRREAAQLLDLLTPVIKAWPSEYCLEANKLAIQCLGGYGYTRDYPVERLYRDNRLNPIHEGTNGIQSLDLLGRKVLADGGKALGLLSQRIGASLRQAAEPPALAAHAADLRAALDRTAKVSMALGAVAAQGQLNLALAHSHAYLEMFGHTVVAWLWLEQARVAQAALPAASAADRDYYAGKLAACRYFYLYELPRTAAQAELLQRLDGGLLELSVTQL